MNLKTLKNVLNFLIFIQYQLEELFLIIENFYTNIRLNIKEPFHKVIYENITLGYPRKLSQEIDMPT